MASKDTLAAAEMKDDFVIPREFAPQMMMFQMASGGANVITAQGLSTLASAMIGSMIPMAKQMVEQAKTELLKQCPVPISDATKAVLDQTIDKALAKAVTPAALKKFIEPLCSIIDLNDSGTISKREFFHVARIAEFANPAMMQQLQSDPTQMKKVVDIVFDLLDTNHDAAISKAEIATYVHRIAHAVGQLGVAFMELVTELFLSEEVFDAVLADAFTAAASLKSLGVDIFDDKGDVSYVKCAPFMQMGEGMLTNMAESLRDSQTPAQMASVKTYMDMEKKAIDGCVSKTDASGNISKADLISVQKESVKAVVDNLKQQFTTMLSALPPAMQGPAMMVSGFMNPVAIFEKVLTAEPFYAIPVTDAIFANFGTGDKLNFNKMKDFATMALAFVKGEIDQSSSPEDRAKAIFGLLDANADGAISSKEAARVVGGLVRVASGLVGVILNIYLGLLGHPDFITGALSAAEGMAPMLLGSFRIPGIAISASDIPKFPLQKSFFEGLIAKSMGGGSDPEKKMKELYAYCDVNGDGVLTFDEFDRIEAGRLTQEQFNLACQMKGVPEANFEIFASMYSNGFSVDKDYARIMSGKGQA